MIGSLRRLLLLMPLSVVVALASGAPAAGAGPMNVGADKVAIKGYDPVAYFTTGKATKGKPELDYLWQDAKWLFATAEHRDQFRANPEKYSPRYGGFCALGIAKGAKFDIDPEAWSIVGGQLYLNYDKGIRDEWRKNAADNIKNADEKWQATN
jgi:hypothetical protein